MNAYAVLATVSALLTFQPLSNPAWALVIDDGVIIPPAQQGPQIAISSYDLRQTPVSGFGCWYHTYSGLRADTGRTASGSVICTDDGIGRVLDYSLGNGTLNDGSLDGTHLFLTRNDDMGQPLEPAILLHLAARRAIGEIQLLQTGFTQIVGVQVQIGATTVELSPSPIGSDPLNVSLDLRGTDLESMRTDTVMLKGFAAYGFGAPIDQFGISEIVIHAAAVPEPTSYAMLLVGLGCLGFAARQRDGAGFVRGAWRQSTQPGNVRMEASSGRPGLPA